MKSWLKLAALSLLLSLGNAALAAGPAAGPNKHVQWQCWYDQGSHVRCLIDAAASTANFESEAAPAALPPLIRAVWADGLRKTTFRFNLEPEQRDARASRAVAEASVCGGYRNCAVAFSAKPPSMAQYIALIQRSDPSAATQLAYATQDWDKLPASTDMALAMAE